jgi:hypothetical protein
VRQQRLEPRRAITSRSGACACRLAARRRAICGATPQGGRCCSGSNICATRNDRLIRPRHILGKQVGDGATVADAAIGRGNDDLHYVGEEAGWWQVRRCLCLLQHRHAHPDSRCGDRQRTHPGEPFTISDEEQPHRGFVDEDRLADWPDEFDHIADAQPSECILPPIGAWLQRNLNAAAKEVDARDRGNASDAIATRLRTHQVQRVTGAKARNQCWRAKLKGDAARG